RYSALAERLRANIIHRFVNERGIYNVALLSLDNGQKVWEDENQNPWEYTWALTLGPFIPDLNLALASAKVVYEEWGKDNYGFCPWNSLSRFLREYMIDDAEYQKMLSCEIKDALTYSDKYPMI